MNVQKLTPRDFDEKISYGISIIFFTSIWHTMRDEIALIMENTALSCNTPVREVDCDEYPELASRYSVMSLPTAILFDNGTEVSRLTGMHLLSTYCAMVSKHGRERVYS